MRRARAICGSSSTTSTLVTGSTYARWRLAARARVGRPVHERLAPDRAAAPGAGQALLAVDGERTVEVAGLAVDVDVERVERGAAGPQRVVHHLGRRGQQ